MLDSDSDPVGPLQRLLWSPSTRTLATVGMILVSGWGCGSYFGRSLAGAPSMSPTEMVLRSLLPVVVLSPVLGFLSGRSWLQTVGAGLIPPVLLGALMTMGFAEHGEFIHGPPLYLLLGMVLSISCLGWAGSRVALPFLRGAGGDQTR